MAQVMKVTLNKSRVIGSYHQDAGIELEVIATDLVKRVCKVRVIDSCIVGIVYIDDVNIE